MIFEKLKQVPKSYWIFAFVRILLTCLPQIGYIHPDEFFQSIEVVAGKTFDVEINRPWEFNATFPIRSVTLPYLTVGTSFQILKSINYFMWSKYRLSIMSPYFVVVFPRMLFCLLSFIVDWSLYKICLTNNEKCKSRSIILAISYVILVYGTRTFSNTIEMILFSLLLYYVAESLIFSMITAKQREYINTRYKEAETVVEKAKFHKLRLFLEDDSLRNCFIISTITAAGFFNRPTFVVYAVGPVFFWLYRGIGFKSIPPLYFHLRAFVFLLCTIPTILLFIVIDSFYFGYLTWAEIGVLEVSINNFVVTPLNFIRYNMDSSNLAQHGLHPRYLHLLVNIPLLFNVLGLLAYANIMDLSVKLMKGRFHYLPTVRSIKGLMVIAFIVPLLLLSIFPHQEPRFLIPLILPLVYLYGSRILPESEDIVVKSFTSEDKPSAYKKTQEPHTLLKMWIVINVILTIFFGFLHQGGIFPFVTYLTNEVKRSNYDKTYQVVTSHIYSIPESLFMQKVIKHDELELNYDSIKRLVIHEEGSNSLEKVLTKIAAILKICQEKSVQYSGCKLYLVLPSSLTDKLLHIYHNRDTNLLLNNTVVFYPHISVEAIPDIMCLHPGEDCLNIFLYPIESVLKFFQSMGLARIRFTLKD